MKDKKMYFLYTEDGSKYINTCLGIEELSKYLNRKPENVRRSLLKMTKEKKFIIRGAKTKFLIISEDDIRGEHGKRKQNSKKVL